MKKAVQKNKKFRKLKSLTPNKFLDSIDIDEVSMASYSSSKKKLLEHATNEFKSANFLEAQELIFHVFQWNLYLILRRQLQEYYEASLESYLQSLKTDFFQICKYSITINNVQFEAAIDPVRSSFGKFLTEFNSLISTDYFSGSKLSGLIRTLEKVAIKTKSPSLLRKNLKKKFKERFYELSLILEPFFYAKSDADLLKGDDAFFDFLKGRFLSDPALNKILRGDNAQTLDVDSFRRTQRKYTIKK